MKLQEYFQNIQSHKLSDKEKNALYERILAKTQNTHKTPLFSHSRFFSKVASYVLLLGAVGLSFYIPYIGQKENTNNPTTAVHADYVAKVVNIQGDYYIESNGNRLESNNISNGDTIVLAENSNLVVHVGDNVEGKITGPATFIVHRQDNGYAITFAKGDYIEVSTLGDQAQAPEVALVSVSHKFTARTNAGQSFHFILTEENDQPLVFNKSSNNLTIINQEDNGNSETTLLAHNKSIEVGNIVILARGSDNIALANEMAKRTEDQPAVNNTDYNNGFFRNLLLNEEEGQTTDTTAKVTDIAVSTSNTPAVAALSLAADTADTTEVQKGFIDRKEVRTNLIPQFVWVDIKYLIFYYLNGQNHEYEIAYGNYLNRITNLYTALNIDMPANFSQLLRQNPHSLQTLSLMTSYLQANLPASIPKYQANTLNTLNTFFQKLQAQAFGAYKDQGLDIEQMFEKIK